jgi:hypothetical protein
MLWVIRWTDFRTFKDHSIVVEAESQEAAEAVARKRRVMPTYLAPASEADVQAAREEQRLWKYGSEGSFECFGQPVGGLQVAFLVLLGISTIGILLQVTGILASVRLAL